MPDDVLELEAPLPSRWPGELYREKFGREKRRQTLVFRPDPGLAEWRDDMDRAVGLAFAHGKTCLFVDEAHEAAPANSTPPHMRRALRQGRHADLTLILATPRPMTIDPLCISAADYVYVFKLPNPADRRRVAENIGWDPRDFDDAVAGLGKFEFLRYDHAADDLAHYPPLPAHFIRGHKS
jgi:DNA helicase HerA-like ATPase